MGFKIKKTVNGETVWEPIKAKKYTASKTIEYTGTLPITITANGESLIDYCIYGNTVQNETPTPENPVMPESVGELETAGTHAGQYKLPILSNSTVTPIYLGEVPTTRRIKKLVLTGKEYCSKNTGIINSNAYSVIAPHYYERRYVGLCSHYATVDNLIVEEGVYFGQGINFLTALSDEIDTLDKWKSYLAAQYAAGTPVTVWYVLAEPQTAVVNEPLMKIGDYTDTISMEQTGVSIPTAAGETIIDYDGTPKPSQMYVKYNSWSGWSDIDNYEMVNGNWTQEVT